MAATRQYFIPSETGGAWIDEQSDDVVNEYFVPGVGWMAESVEAAAGGLPGLTIAPYIPANRAI